MRSKLKVNGWEIGIINGKRRYWVADSSEVRMVFVSKAEAVKFAKTISTSDELIKTV